jgi:hypothetical protein
MAFRREDITVEERVGIVVAILADGGPPGLVSALARRYGVSRQTLYELAARGASGLVAALAPRPAGRPALGRPVVVDRNRLERAVVTLTVVGHASLEGVRGCLEEVLGVRRSTGYLSEVLDRAAAGARRCLAEVCPAGPVRADLDEIYAHTTPNLLVVEPDSTLILALERAAARDSTSWGVALLDLAARGVALAEVASDGGPGLIAGLAEAGLAVPRVADLFHVLRDVFGVAGMLEKAAYRAIAAEERARLTEAEARAPVRRRGGPRRSPLSLAEAAAARAEAVRRYDGYAYVVGCARAGLEPVDPETGRLRAPAAAEAELGAATALLGEHPDERARAAGARLSRSAGGLAVYLAQLADKLAPELAEWGAEAVALMCWAWRHRAGLGLAEGSARDAAFPPAQGAAVAAVWAALSGAHRGSSLAECVNSLLRPHLLAHRGADQNLLDLLACYLNHRVFRRGKRRGRSPIQIAGLAAAGDWLQAIGLAPKDAPSPRPTRTRQAPDLSNALVNLFAA